MPTGPLGGVPTAPVGGTGSQFNDLLAFDPDHLDSGPQPAAPPGAPVDPHAGDPHPPVAPPPPPPPQHERLYFTLVDANSDGLDDSLQEAGGIPAPAPHPAHDDAWYHDHGHGGTH